MVHSFKLTNEIIKQYQPILLSDIKIVTDSKLLIIEAFLRYYDLLSHVEASSSKSHKRVIGVSKQKVIFYLAYVKSEKWSPKLNLTEFSQMFL